MKKIFHVLLLWGIALISWAQGVPALEQVKADPRKAYGQDIQGGQSPEGIRDTKEQC